MATLFNLWDEDERFYKRWMEFNDDPDFKGVVIINGIRKYKGGPDSEFGQAAEGLTHFFKSAFQEPVDIYGNLKDYGISATRAFLENDRIKTQQVPISDLFRIPDWDSIYKRITDEEKGIVLTKHFECGVPQFDDGRYTGILVTSETHYKDYLQYKQKLIGKYTGLSEWLVGFADYLHVKLHNIKNQW